MRIRTQGIQGLSGRKGKPQKLAGAVNQLAGRNIRGSSNGAKWPSSAAVDATSFLGKLQSRTKLNFDLPTAAQWEYACRAGTTTTYYWGNSMNGDYAWYDSNSGSESHPVGTRKPNAWGLYDLIGCCHQWTTTSPVLGSNGGPARHADGVDPIGPAPQMGAGPFRVCKGSHCNPGDAKARVGRLAYRFLQRSNCQNGMLNGTSYNAEQSDTGCRLALTLDVK